MKFPIVLIFGYALVAVHTTPLTDDVTAVKRSLANWDLTHVLALKEKALQGVLMNLLIGTYDNFCDAIVQLPMLPQPNVEHLNFQFMTPTHNYSIPLTDALQLLAIPAYDRQKPLVVFATGWQNTVAQSGALHQFWRAFSCRGDMNFIAVDAANYVDTFYTWSARNAELIGEHIGNALAILYAFRGFRWASVHLVGHSLGAQIVGEAARQFRRLTGRQLPRITALDPARPCFTRGARGLLSVQRGDARMVVVVHTNMGVLGKRGPLGDIDFYPGGAVAIQPGCFTIGCSHSRAIDYFAESVYPEQEHHFVGEQCADWSQLVAQNCSRLNTNTMGLALNWRHRGIFYVPIRREAPYGLGADKSQKPKCRHEDEGLPQNEPTNWLSQWLRSDVGTARTA